MDFELNGLEEEESIHTESMSVDISNLTVPQAKALRDFLANMEQFGRIDASKWITFFCDGDNDFMPDIKIDGIPTAFHDPKSGNRDELWDNGDYKCDPRLF